MIAVQNFSNVLTLAKDDDDFIMTFIAKSTEDLANYLQSIKAASASENLPLLLFTKHKSSTLLMLLGDTEVASLIDAIVEKAKNRDWDLAPEIIRLEIETRGLIYRINTELKTQEDYK